MAVLLLTQSSKLPAFHAAWDTILPSHPTFFESLLATMFIQEFLGGLDWVFIPRVRPSVRSALQDFQSYRVRKFFGQVQRVLRRVCSGSSHSGV